MTEEGRDKGGRDGEEEIKRGRQREVRSGRGDRDYKDRRKIRAGRAKLQSTEAGESELRED